MYWRVKQWHATGTGIVSYGNYTNPAGHLYTAGTPIPIGFFLSGTAVKETDLLTGNEYLGYLYMPSGAGSGTDDGTGNDPYDDTLNINLFGGGVSLGGPQYIFTEPSFAAMTDGTNFYPKFTAQLDAQGWFSPDVNFGFIHGDWTISYDAATHTFTVGATFAEIWGPLNLTISPSQYWSYGGLYDPATGARI